MAPAAAGTKPQAPGVYRRDLGHDYHGQAPWPARRGQRLVAAVPHGHWKTSTFLAALRHDRITAPCVFDGASNGERFRAYVEQALAPTLDLATS